VCHSTRCGQGEGRKAIGSAQFIAGETLDEDPEWIRKIDAVLRYELRLDPDELSDQEWALAYRDFCYLESRRANLLESTFGKVMNEVLKAFSGNG
jgi:hypothetical protein